MSSRFVSLILAGVLLFTQHLGLQHLLSHGLQGAAAAAAGGPPESRPERLDDHRDGAGHGSAEGLCQACLALAVLGTATLPGLLRLATLSLRGSAPAAPLQRGLPRRTSAPYLARAPPSLARR